MCELARCDVCDVCHSETLGISSLEKQTSVNSLVQADTSSNCGLLKCKNIENLLWAAEVNPVLPVTIEAAGASEKGSKY